MDRSNASSRLRATTLVAVVSHDRLRAQAFEAALRLAISGIDQANPEQLQFVHGDQAQTADAAALTLLLAWEDADPDAGASSLSALQAHQTLRRALQTRGVTFSVLRGDLQHQLQQALAALSRFQTALKPPGAQTLRPPGWQASCQNCDDPDCEHRLLSDLLARR